ncbi:MAG: hypothetical protein ACFFB5_02015 [Promethearchaeota archaeon]
MCNTNDQENIARVEKIALSITQELITQGFTTAAEVGDLECDPETGESWQWIPIRMDNNLEISLTYTPSDKRIFLNLLGLNTLDLYQQFEEKREGTTARLEGAPFPEDVWASISINTFKVWLDFNDFRAHFEDIRTNLEEVTAEAISNTISKLVCHQQEVQLFNAQAEEIGLKIPWAYFYHRTHSYRDPGEHIFRVCLIGTLDNVRSAKAVDLMLKIARKYGCEARSHTFNISEPTGDEDYWEFPWDYSCMYSYWIDDDSQDSSWHGIIDQEALCEDLERIAHIEGEFIVLSDYILAAVSREIENPHRFTLDTLWLHYDPLLRESYFVITDRTTGEQYPLGTQRSSTSSDRIILTPDEWNVWRDNYRKFLSGTFQLLKRTPQDKERFFQVLKKKGFDIDKYRKEFGI